MKYAYLLKLTLQISTLSGLQQKSDKVNEVSTTKYWYFQFFFMTVNFKISFILFGHR